MEAPAPPLIETDNEDAVNVDVTPALEDEDEPVAVEALDDNRFALPLRLLLLALLVLLVLLLEAVIKVEE